MAEESDLEKTESPSSRRLEQAREEGQVPRSRELSTLVGLLAGSGGLWLLGGQFSHRFAAVLSDGLTFDRTVGFDPQAVLLRFAAQTTDSMFVLAPLLVAAFAAALLAPILIGGLIFTPKPLEPDFSRLDPVAGLGRMFSMRGLVELGKALAKAFVVGAASAWLLWGVREETLGLIQEPLVPAFAHAARMVAWGFLVLAGAFGLLALFDVPYQLWDHNRRLRMSRAELRQEARESDGDPQVKARIRAQQREMARRRMMTEVPRADVVVTNPTHYAVALRYTDGGMRAPRVIAKGSGLVAQRIREIASDAGVPLVEAPPLARALHRHTEIGDEIPQALYTAVAEVLAYVYRLRAHLRGEGPAPDQPGSIDVPPELDPAGGEA